MIHWMIEKFRGEEGENRMDVQMPVHIYGYWRSFQAVRERVEARGGDVLAAFRQGPVPAGGKEDHPNVQL